MRKLIVSINVSLDGLVAGPNDELDWHFNSWTTDMSELLCEQLSKADTILLGKHTYNRMAGFWPTASTNYSFPREDIAYADMMNRYTKVVFSGSIRSLPWGNTKVIKGDVYKQILQLKRENGKDIIIYGSGKLVSSLHQLSLIDEYVLWIHPLVLGRGKRLFERPADRSSIRLTRMRHFSSGVTVLNYSRVT